MARKLRFEQPGGLYHVLNRGNYRSWIFETEGAKVSFEKALFETCTKAGWILHAYCVMGNHYHLALETPEPNLSEGMRQMQSAFSIRFNRFRKEKGHIFQGRFKSVVVGDWERLGWLCHYIHLNPIRARMCTMEGLRSLNFCSYHHLWNKRKRPPFLKFGACLDSAGNLRDSPTGRRKYADYLAWLAEDEPRQKAMRFDKMSKGWAMGTKSFKSSLLEDEKNLRACLEFGVSEAQEMREVAWSEALEKCHRALNIKSNQSHSTKKSEDWKVAIAGYMKQNLMCRNGWLAERLKMGTEYGVSRYVTEMLNGNRKSAKTIYDRLRSRVKD